MTPFVENKMRLTEVSRMDQDNHTTVQRYLSLGETCQVTFTLHADDEIRKLLLNYWVMINGDEVGLDTLTLPSYSLSNM